MAASSALVDVDDEVRQGRLQPADADDAVRAQLAQLEPTLAHAAIADFASADLTGVRSRSGCAESVRVDPASFSMRAPALHVAQSRDVEFSTPGARRFTRHPPSAIAQGGA